MKIAVATDMDMVSEHFGHCKTFTIFDVENNQIVEKHTIGNPGDKPGFLPNFLHEFGANVVITGGMGGKAIEIFNDKGIEVVTGSNGNAEEVAKLYMQGILKSTEAVCHEHHHD